eukprot:2206050-Ditylum_brightwellii.AAC.1
MIGHRYGPSTRRQIWCLHDHLRPVPPLPSVPVTIPPPHHCLTASVPSLQPCMKNTARMHLPTNRQ